MSLRTPPLLLALLPTLLLAACAPIPKLPTPAAALQGEQLGLASQEQAGLASPSSEWWQGYGDADLNALVEKALADAPSLALARARIARAGAGVEAAEAADKPATGLGLDLQRQLYTETGLVPPPIAGSVRNTATLQMGISYDWDFFGRHQAALQAALGQRRAAQADAAAARLTLAAQVMRSYLALARVLAQRQLLAEQQALRTASLQLVRERAAAGLDTQLELRGAEAPVAELQRQGLALDEQAQALRHQLAALTVQPAQALAELRPALPAALAWQQEPGIELLGRRPDLQAARWRVEAATQDVTVARSQFYPNVTLTAFAGFSAIGFDRLLESRSFQAGFGPSLRLPIFDTGRLRAQLKGSAAEQDAAVAAFNAALLEAVRDASDQLNTMKSLQAQAQTQATLVANAEQQLKLAEQRQQAGLGNRLPVLAAQQALLAQQRQALDLRGLGLDAQVNLMRALGGGTTESN